MEDRAWERIKGLFHQALEQPSAQRGSFLKHACSGDAELCAEVEALLAAHEEARLLEPESAPGADAGALGESAGTVIGPYKLLQRIGEGGFGVVYMAEQIEPVRRIVALKIIKLGMDTRQVIARFEAERQALALMDHPNIARVLDAGATATGRPYFVMELVRGVPITEYCDANKLGTRQRLQLFVDVCHAVRHAHQKGVIHRDLKPSNVMVTLHDGTPVPKVIDFGIAKATGPRLTEKTLFTEFKQFLGTPEYTSPEQAEMSGLDIDTRADIYSLGVLLYELLTGTTPLDAKSLRCAAYGEILRLIREAEPPKPSTRVSTLGERVAEVARQRGTEPRSLNRLLLGDLDWIVMKALEKDRTRRYESADGFAQDVERYLRDEPVLASPPSALYKLRKFTRRNRALIGGLSVVAGALVIGAAAATFGLVRAQSQRDRAIAAEESAKRETERVAKVNAFLRRFLTAPSTPWNSVPGALASTFAPDVKVVQVVDEVVKSLDDEFEGEPGLEAELRLAIGESYLGLSRYPEAEVQVRRAIELYRQLSGGEDMPAMDCLSMLGAALSWQGRFEEADDCFVKAIAGCRRLAGARAVPTLNAENDYVSFLMDKPNEPEAVPLARHVVEGWRELRGPEAPETLHAEAMLAFALNSAGRLEEASALATTTFEAVQRTLGDRAELYGFCLVLLGNVSMARGDAIEAERRYRAMLERAKGSGHEDLFEGAIAADQLARALAAQERWAEAEVLDRKASAAYLRNFGKAHPYTFSAFARLARTLREQGKDAEAETCYRDLVEMCAGADSRGVNQSDEARRLLARHLARTGRAAEAEPIARAAVEGFRRALRARSDVPAAVPGRARSLITGLGTWGDVLEQLGRDDEAAEALREAVEVADRSLVDEDAAVEGALEGLAIQCDVHDRLDDAERLCRRVLEARRRAYGEQETSTLVAQNNLAWMLHRLGRDAEAEPLSRGAVEGLGRTAQASTSDRIVFLDTYACILDALRRSSEGEALFEEIESLEQSVPEAQRLPEIALHHAQCLVALDRREEAQQRLTNAYELLRARGQGDSRLARQAAARLAELYADAGRAQESAAWLSKTRDD
jgi:eukaryotic-like serine/threonine-protein kinase